MAASPVVRLDPDSIRNFANGDLSTLHGDVEDLQRGGANGLWSVDQFTAGGGGTSLFEGMAMPLPIGNLAADAFSAGGAALQAAVEQYVTDLAAILLRQGVITSDLAQTLLNCVADMQNNQLSSLDMINMQKAENLFEGVYREADPAPTPASTNTSTNTGT